jgi:phosphatidylserine/phosphatidylglycerophosphate/cardiolipin synthase-like enzyme
MEIITNSVLTSDNFFTQSVIDMHTGPKLFLSEETENIWLDSDLEVNEHNLAFINSPQWQEEIIHPRLRLYQTGKIDSIRLDGDKYYGKLHAKFIVTDQLGFVGTSNFDFRSMLFNNEVGFFILGEAPLDTLNQEFELLKSQSYLWGSAEWLELREMVRQAGGMKGFTTKSQRSIYKVLKNTGLKFQF